MSNRIYLFANFGDWNKQPYGGGEVGNRRTLALLRKGGFDVRIIEKYKRVKNHSPMNLLLLMTKMVLNTLKFFIILFCGRRKQSIVHIVGFYGPMVYFEHTLVRISKMLGYKTVYEMRGGGADLYYQQGSNLYRKMFSEILNRSDCVFTQGVENKSLIKKLSPDVPVFYYPNFVTEDFYPNQYPLKPKDRVNLFYFGRVSKTKNLDTVLDAFFILAEKYDNVFLDIVGNCPEPDYAEHIHKRIAQSGYKERLNIHPACNHEQLKVHLKDKHFYLFPTKEPHEGHSNAMTEAMAWGLIPIATSQGFNKSVIGNAGVVVDDIKPELFADAIDDCMKNGSIEEMSKSAYYRVIDNYTENIVSKRMTSYYRQLFE